MKSCRGCFIQFINLTYKVLRINDESNKTAALLSKVLRMVMVPSHVAVRFDRHLYDIPLDIAAGNNNNNIFIKLQESSGSI